MSALRLQDYLEHMARAAQEVLEFSAGFDRDTFLADRRTQQAVIMSLVVLGEASARLIEHHPEFADAHPTIPWLPMRGMRNRLAHGYFDVDLDIVWDTVTNAIPDLSIRLSKLSSR